MVVSILQVYVLLLIASFWRLEAPPGLALLPALVLPGLMSASLNPFTQAVELIRFALYGELNLSTLLVRLGLTAACLGLAISATTRRGFMAGKRGD